MLADDECARKQWPRHRSKTSPLWFGKTTYAGGQGQGAIFALTSTMAGRMPFCRMPPKSAMVRLRHSRWLPGGQASLSADPDAVATRWPSTRARTVVRGTRRTLIERYENRASKPARRPAKQSKHWGTNTCSQSAGIPTPPPRRATEVERVE